MADRSADVTMGAAAAGAAGFSEDFCWQPKVRRESETMATGSKRFMDAIPPISIHTNETVKGRDCITVNGQRALIDWYI
jgi:hypothetical protein